MKSDQTNSVEHVNKNYFANYNTIYLSEQKTYFVFWCICHFLNTFCVLSKPKKLLYFVTFFFILWDLSRIIQDFIYCAGFWLSLIIYEKTTAARALTCLLFTSPAEQIGPDLNGEKSTTKSSLKIVQRSSNSLPGRDWEIYRSASKCLKCREV